MTRKEEIARAAKDYHIKKHPNFTYREYVAFIDGAHWADQHPSTEAINRIIELYKRWYSQQCDVALADYIKQNY